MAGEDPGLELTDATLLHVVRHLAEHPRALQAIRLTSCRWRDVCDAVGILHAAPQGLGPGCWLARCRSLRSLELRWQAELGDEGVVAALLRQLPKLRELRVGGQPAADAACTALAAAPSAAAALTALHLGGASSALLALLEADALTGLHSLRLSGQGEARDLRALLQHAAGALPSAAAAAAALPRLCHLAIEGAPCLGDGAFCGLPPLPHATAISFAACTSLGDGCLRWLGSHGEQLRGLSLEHAAEEATDLAALGTLQGLTTLDLSGTCDLAAPEVLFQLLAKLPAGSLRALRLRGCESVTPESLRVIGDRLTGLTSLSVAGLPTRAAAGVAHLSRLAALQDLDCSWNESLDAATLAQAVRGMAALTALNLAYCAGLEGGGLAALAGAAAGPRLASLNLIRCFGACEGARRSSGGGGGGGGSDAWALGALGAPLLPSVAAPGFNSFSLALHSLRDLRLCGDVEDVGWLAGLQGSLTHLTLRRMRGARTPGWSALAALEKLESMYLTHSRLAPGDLVPLGTLAHCGRLGVLSLVHCTALQPGPTLAPLTAAPRLTRLDLRGFTGPGLGIGQGLDPGLGLAPLLASLPQLHVAYSDASEVQAAAGPAGRARPVVAGAAGGVPLMV